MQDVYQLGIFQSCANQPCLNVFHFRNGEEEGVNPDASARDLIDAWVAEIGGLFKACLPEDTLIQGCRARRVNNGGGPSVSQSYAAAPGDRAGVVSTSSVGPCIIWGYNTGIRWRTGRTFLCGVSEDDIEENVIAADLRTACETFMDAMVSGFAGDVHEWEFVIWQPRAAGGPITSGVETATVRGIPGTQRRRMLPSF